MHGPMQTDAMPALRLCASCKALLLLSCCVVCVCLRDRWSGGEREGQTTTWSYSELVDPQPRRSRNSWLRESESKFRLAKRRATFARWSGCPAPKDMAHRPAGGFAVSRRSFLPEWLLDSTLDSVSVFGHPVFHLRLVLQTTVISLLSSNEIPVFGGEEEATRTGSD